MICECYMIIILSAWRKAAADEYAEKTINELFASNSVVLQCRLTVQLSAILTTKHLTGDASVFMELAGERLYDL